MGRKIKGRKGLKRKRVRRTDGVRQRYWLKTNVRGHVVGLRVREEGERGRTRRVPVVQGKRLGLYSTHGTMNERRDKDARKIIEIYNMANSREINIPNLQEVLTGRPRYRIFTDSRNHIVGVGAFDRFNFEIKQIFIHPNYRMRNYDTSIAKKLESYLKNIGASYALVFVKRSNSRKQEFWRNMGYERAVGSCPLHHYRYQKNFMLSESQEPFRVLRVV